MLFNLAEQYNPLKEVKQSAAERWVAAVNADGAHGRWCYRVVSKASEIDAAVSAVAAEMG